MISGVRLSSFFKMSSPWICIGTWWDMTIWMIASVHCVAFYGGTMPAFAWWSWVCEHEIDYTSKEMEQTTPQMWTVLSRYSWCSESNLSKHLWYTKTLCLVAHYPRLTCLTIWLVRTFLFPTSGSFMKQQFDPNLLVSFWLGGDMTSKVTVWWYLVIPPRVVLWVCKKHAILLDFWCFAFRGKTKTKHLAKPSLDLVMLTRPHKEKIRKV